MTLRFGKTPDMPKTIVALHDGTGLIDATPSPFNEMSLAGQCSVEIAWLLTMRKALTRHGAGMVWHNDYITIHLTRHLVAIDFRANGIPIRPISLDCAILNGTSPLPPGASVIPVFYRAAAIGRPSHHLLLRALQDSRKDMPLLRRHICAPGERIAEEIAVLT